MLFTVDIGTSALKSALWDYNGNRVSFASLPLTNTFEDSKHETEPSNWLRAFETCCKMIDNPSIVDAIIISGNGPSLVPVTGEPSFNSGLCVPACNARLWMDARAAEYQTQVSELMGGYVDASFFLPKILKIKNEEKQLYDKTKYFLGCPEYLSYALTGNVHSLFPSDGFDRWFWNDEVLLKLKLDADKLPPFIRPGEQFGKILPKAARYLGFKENIPVISGGPDFFAAIIGCAVVEAGQVCDRTGSSEGINLCTQSRIIDPRLMSYGHPIKPYWNLSGIINTTGKAIEWGCNLLGVTFDKFIELACQSESGSGGLVFIPYLAGERAPVWDPSVRAVLQGIGLSAGRSEFANSLLEGIGFAIRNILTVMEEAGGNPAQMRVTGRLAGCERLNQIKADITGKEIAEQKQKEAELLGLAIIGSVSLGKYSSFKEAAGVMVKIDKIYKPNCKNKGIYDKLFQKYITTEVK